MPMENKKYRLDYTDIGYVTLYRIVALKDFGDVHKGDIGGYVQSEKNLSQDGNCWIYNDAIVKGDAVVLDNAKIYGENINSCYGGQLSNGNPWYYRTVIEGNVRVYENAIVNRSHVHGGDIKIHGNALIEESQVNDCAELYDNCWIYRCMVSDFCKIYGKARLQDCCVTGHVQIYNDKFLLNQTLKDDESQ